MSNGKHNCVDLVEAFTRDKQFPCVGAKSALAQGNLKLVVCRSITSAWDDLRIHSELFEWASAYRSDPGLFRSLAFIFPDSPKLTEADFEEALWERAQSLADKDAWLGVPYDERVSPDPENPHFSLSYGGEAFFVVGMHPGASRAARRAPYPMLVFNLHDQFETLREQGRYDAIRAAIVKRDEMYSGSVNPMLARHGETSEAVQYSGRVVGAEWQCPFQDKRAAE